MLSSRLAIVLSACAYFIMVLMSYALVESVLYKEIHFEYVELSAAIQVLIAVMAVAPALWLPKRTERPSHVALWMLYATVMVPSMLLPFHISIRPVEEIVLFCGFLQGLFALLFLIVQLPVWQLSLPKIRQGPLLATLIFIAFFLMILIAQTAGFHINLSLENIYDRRLDARQVVQGGAFSAYAIVMLSHSLSPILFGYGIVERNAAAICTGILGILCTFSLAGSKSELSSLPMMLGVLVLVSQGRKTPSLYFILGGTGLVLASMLQFLVLGRNDISVYFVRRVIFLPGLMSSVYWDFFSQNPHIWYRDSFLRWLGDSPYSLPMARLIGEAYFHSHESNANGNLWASGYGHSGYLGMFVATLLLGWTLRIIDSLSITCGFRLVVMMTALFSIGWSNGSVETSMLSYGVLPSLVIFSLLRMRDAEPMTIGNENQFAGHMLSPPYRPPRPRHEAAVRPRVKHVA